MKKLIVLFTIFLGSNYFFAQEETTHLEEDQESVKNSIRIGFGIGHAHITEDVEEDKDHVIKPSFYLDLDYWFTDKIAAGIQADLIYEDFVIEKGEEELIEREKPIALVPVAIYKPFEHFMFIGGYGIEFSKEENFSLLRMGAEYGVELPKRWEFGVSLIYDIKLDAYDTWVLGLGVSKFIGGKKK